MAKPKDEISEELNRCAILMLSIGEDAAAEVFKHLNPREVQQIGSAMAKLQTVSRSDVDEVLEDFRQEADQFLAVSLDSNNYIRSALTKALGNDRAASLIEDILESGNSSGSGIEALNWLEPANVAELIAEEHPQIIAAILVHLERDHASDILSLLNERVRNDVIMRIATFGGVQPAALHELTEMLNEVLSGQGAKRSKMGGVRAAAEILNYMNTSDEELAIKNLRNADNDLAQRIIDEMFVFDNLIDVDDSAIQLILKEVESSSVAIALKGAEEDLRHKFFSNMSNRAAEILKEDMETLGPIRMSQVETEQKAILMVARNLADTGRIDLSTNKDDYV